MVTILY